MTVKKLTKIENGRLTPTDLSMDADLIEISTIEGNKLEIKEDGLYYKERSVIDGLESDGETIGIKDYGIDPKKISKISSTASSTEVTPETLQSLEDHLANLYGFIQRLKGEYSGSPLYSLQALSDGYTALQEQLVRDYYSKSSVDDSLSLKVDKVDLESYPLSPTTLYGSSGILSTSPKIFTGVAVANSDGDWSIDYSSVGFTQVPVVTVSGQTIGTNLGDRRFASLGIGQPTLTSCSGKLLSSSSAGLLAAMTMVAAGGNVNVVAIGY